MKASLMAVARITSCGATLCRTDKNQRLIPTVRPRQRTHARASQMNSSYRNHTVDTTVDYTESPAAGCIQDYVYMSLSLCSNYTRHPQLVLCAPTHARVKHGRNHKLLRSSDSLSSTLLIFPHACTNTPCTHARGGANERES